MNRLCELGVVFILLFMGFWLLFRRIRWLKLMSGLLHRTKESMDESYRRRLLENRQRLLAVQKEHSLWVRLEQELQYSGLAAHLPFLTVERWIAVNVAVEALIFILFLIVLGQRAAWMGALLLLAGEILFIQACKMRAMRSVNNNLLKFLDFLGNYSITAGEITGIFHQVSKYVDEPLKGVLEECCYEAQTTGDAGLALLSMAEKIEHPKFKELVRNMEINLRYCADFTILVRSSRRGMRDYLKLGEERRSMMREAVINMGLLLGMSLFVLFTVNRLTDISIWRVLFDTMPGRIALGVVGIILLLFLGQIYRMER